MSSKPNDTSLISMSLSLPPEPGFEEGVHPKTAKIEELAKDFSKVLRLVMALFNIHHPKSNVQAWGETMWGQDRHNAPRKPSVIIGLWIGPFPLHQIMAPGQTQRGPSMGRVDFQAELVTAVEEH